MPFAGFSLESRFNRNLEMETEEDPMTNESYEGKPAGFWIRVLAQLLDGVVLMVPMLVIGGFFGLLEVLLNVHSSFGEGLVGLVILFCCAAISLLYYSLMTSKKGQTLGKMVFNLKVVDAEGSAPSFKSSLIRWFSYALSALPIYIGYILAAFNGEKRALHDYLAGTRVVYKGAPNTVAVVLVLVLVGGGSLFGGVIAGVLAFQDYRHMETMATDSVNKTSLRNIQSAVQVYYVDQVAYPKDLGDLVPKYLDKMPILDLKKYGMGSSAQVESYSFLDPAGQVDSSKLKNTGHWLYDPATGKVIIDCTKDGTGGTPICQYSGF